MGRKDKRAERCSGGCKNSSCDSGAVVVGRRMKSLPEKRTETEREQGRNTLTSLLPGSSFQLVPPIADSESQGAWGCCLRSQVPGAQSRAERGGEQWPVREKRMGEMESSQHRRKLSKCSSGLPCCCSATQSCPTFCDPIDCSMPGFPVLHHLLKIAQTHVRRVSDAIQTSHPLLSPSLPAFNISSIRVFSSESTLCIRWPNYWSFSFSLKSA